MNGKCSKRIRNAAFRSGRPKRALKREYMALPYHRRDLNWLCLDDISHSFMIKQFLVRRKFKCDVSLSPTGRLSQTGPQIQEIPKKLSIGVIKINSALIA